MKTNIDFQKQYIKESIFLVGYVSSVSWRTIQIKVNKNKNTSHLLYDGKILKNTSVWSYIKIVKWFTKIIGKVEWEYTEISKKYNEQYSKEEDMIDRYLQVSLFWHFDWQKFEQGIKEMPLVYNECYLLDEQEYKSLHQFYGDWEKIITLGSLSEESSQKIEVSINKLFASHIGIFGNTWSGKSNTLARIYYELFDQMKENQKFIERSKFILIDFNWEYCNKDIEEDEIITKNKKRYILNTRSDTEGNKIPLNEKDLIDAELLSILSSATEKTQKPFIIRTIKLYNDIVDLSRTDIEILDHFKNSIKNIIKIIFWMVEKERSHLLLEYIKNILNITDQQQNDYDWSNSYNYFYLRNIGHGNWQINDNQIQSTYIFNQVNDYNFPQNLISKFVHFLRLQIIYDILNDKKNEHIAPVIHKLESKQTSLNQVLDTESHASLFEEWKNLVIINLKDVNLDIKKMIPLILAKKIYEEQKSNPDFSKQSLHIIIDEAHNILSDYSERESETWKDYRLETFEEIIKEWRKFNTFLTIASQRPYDISHTILSQLHNYFIHRLINDFDINAIHKTVAYLDKLSFESIPILPTGSCFFSGQATNIPVKVDVTLLDKDRRPRSWTVELEDIRSNDSEPEDNNLPF